MCGASGEKSLGRKDRLSETKRLGCAGPKNELWSPWTFGSQALNRIFSALIRRSWRATWGQVKFGPPASETA
jgi:hypothetical protein